MGLFLPNCFLLSRYLFLSRVRPPPLSPPERGLGSVSIALGILTQWLKLLQSLVVSSSGQKGELHIVHT